MFVAALHRQQRNYVNWEKRKSRKRGMRGAALLQVQDDGNRRHISYASRSLSDAEKRYAVIEKEALAGVWACEKFSEYVVGMIFVLETDHKPLQTLFNTTELSKTPPRIQRFRLRLMRFSVTVKYVPGKHQ